MQRVRLTKTTQIKLSQRTEHLKAIAMYNLEQNNVQPFSTRVLKKKKKKPVERPEILQQQTI